MKKVIVISSILLFSLFSKAQEAKDTTHSKWAIGGAISPVYTFNTYHWGNNQKSKTTLGYDIFARYKVSKYVDISLGGTFDNLSTKVGDVQVFGFYNFSLICFPLRIILKFENKDLFIGISPGLSLSILNSNQFLYYYYGNSAKPYTIYLNGKVLYFYNLTTYFNYKVNKNISISIQPEFLRALTPLVFRGNYPINNYLQYFKTNLGFYYSI